MDMILATAADNSMVLSTPLLIDYYNTQAHFVFFTWSHCSKNKLPTKLVLMVIPDSALPIDLAVPAVFYHAAKARTRGIAKLSLANSVLSMLQCNFLSTPLLLWKVLTLSVEHFDGYRIRITPNKNGLSLRYVNKIITMEHPAVRLDVFACTSTLYVPKNTCRHVQFLLIFVFVLVLVGVEVERLSTILSSTCTVLLVLRSVLPSDSLKNT